MDFKSMLQQLSQLSEGTQETEKGRVHKADPGGYGRKFDTDEEGDEKKDDKKKTEPAAKRGRGRPKKGADSDTGQVAKYDNAKNLQSFMVGNLPKGKLPGKPGKKHSIKEWIEEIENKYVAENAPGQQLTVKPMPGAAQLVDPASNKVMATGDAAAVKNIQGAVAQGKVQMRGEEMTEGSEPVASGELLKFAQEKANHMGHQTYPVEYKGRIGRISGFRGDDTLTIEFADKPGYVFSGIPENAVTRYQPVQPEKKSSMWESDEDYSAKKARAGKDIGKPGKQFAKIAKGAAKKYGSEESGKKVAGAVLAKLRKKVSEADIPSDQVDMGAGLGAGRSAKTFEGKKPDFLDLDKDKNKKESMSDAAKDAEKKKKKLKENAHRHSSARLLGKAHALARESYNCKYDDLDEVRMYHEGYKEGLDECYGQGVYEAAPAMPPATTGGMANAALEEDNISTRSYRINDAESFQYACSFDESRCEADDRSATKGIITIEGVPSPELKTLMSQLLQSGVAKPIAGFTHRDITGKARFVGKPAMEDALTEGNTEKRTASQWLADPKLDTQVMELQVDGINITNAGKGLRGFTDGGKGYPYASEPYTSAKNPMYFKDFLKHVMSKLGDVKVLGVLQAGPGMAVGEGNAFTKFLATHDKGETGTVGGKTFTDRSNYDAKINEFAFESLDKQLNALLNEDSVSEGMSVSISKGNQGSPDSVSVTAQDAEADQLLAMIKQSGLGLFGQEGAGDFGVPSDGSGAEKHGEINVVGDHDGMMSLIKKVTGASSEEGSNDYEDEEGHDGHDHEGHEHTAEETCNECGYMESKCQCDEESVMGEEESYEQEEEQVAEDNPPDSDAAETTADEDAEAEEDQALATANESNQAPSAPVSQHSVLQRVSGPNGLKSLVPYEKKPPESKDDEKVTEWANDAGQSSEEFDEETFTTNEKFMNKTLAGGLNKPKSTGQTTVPVVASQMNRQMAYESILDIRRLAGIK